MKPLKDYSFVRGVCYGPRKDREQQERELTYCERLQLNSVRMWMRQEDYEKDPEGYLARIEDFMEHCWQHGISTMPIFWNGNFITDFHPLTQAQLDSARAYAQGVIARFRDKPYILMWDAINEPMCNDYMHTCQGEEKARRLGELTTYVRQLCGIIRELDPEGCLTVGHEQVSHCASSEDLVDVISFHDYLCTRREVEGALEAAEAIGKRLGKPILNTETGCVGRANPYEVELELLMKHQVGWYVFNLVSEGFWGDIHGLVYPDGTIRDPSVIAALFGFFRNRTPQRIRVNANKEGHAYRAVKAVEDALRVEPTTLFMSRPKTTEEILEAAEYCVNILESAEMVPMWDAPSARIADWRAQPEGERDVWAIRRFAFEMAELVKKNCMIL